jgi:HD-like signal output (HDOD) protein
MSTLQSALVVLGLILGIACVVAWLRPRARQVDLPRVVEAEPAPVTPAQPPSELTAPAAPADSADQKPTAQQVMRNLYAMAFDELDLGAATSSPPAQHAEVVAASIRMLRTIETQTQYAPRRPSLLPQLLEAINGGEASLRAMAKIIAQDPALTGNLLRIANSPLYRINPKPVESIERAVTLIGTQGIRSIIAAALLQPVLPKGGAFGTFPEIIWEHTLYSASSAEAHAALVENSDPFAAQMLGLLQGLGSIIVFRVARDQYATRPDIKPDANVIAALLGSWSGATARRVAQSWALSDRIQHALHDQLLETMPDQLSPLGRSLRFGRVAGALVMLCSAGRLEESRALAALGDADSGPLIGRIWERLRRAKR